MRAFDDRRKALQALGDGAVDVLLREGFAGRGEHQDLVGLAGQRRLQPLEVGHQHGIANPGPAFDGGHHGGVVAHLRHPLGADEAGDLDLLEAGVLQLRNQLRLVLGGDIGLLVLQAVAGADVQQFDVGGEGHGSALVVERVQVCQVLQATRGTLVLFEVVEPDEAQWDAIHRDDLAPCVTVGELHTVDAHQEVDATWGLAELDHRIRGEICDGQPQRLEAESAKHQQQTLDVGVVPVEPEVDIPGVARMPMRGERVAAHHEVVNAVRVEQLGKLFEVGVEHRGVPPSLRAAGAGSRPLPRAPPPGASARTRGRPAPGVGGW
mmetsp:Transcript_5904/g.14537  ORF Transcript_5904/g.14537 Transcript_5904/m.14537 type:complete len:322 (+) Transcript_5904:446-1411(+)